MSSPSYRAIHFNALPEAVRVHLADCLAGKTQTKPLVALPTSRKRGWIMLALVGLVILFGMWAMPKEKEFLEEGAMIGFALGTLFSVAGVVGVMHARRLRQALPFRPGRYVFATDFIEATGPVLRFYNLNEVKSLNATHHYTNGIYTGTRFVIKLPGKTVNFSISGRKKADGVLSDLHVARATFAFAVKNQDLAALEALDPLFHARVSDGWKDLGTTPPSLPRDAVAQAREVPWPFARAVQPWAVAFLATLPLAPAQWWIDNRLRDEAIFRAAQERPSEEKYRKYLNGGKNHVEEVKAELLPKAVLDEAKHRRSVPRLRQFTRDFAGHRLVPEAEAEIRKVYQDSLQTALQRAEPSAHDFLRKLFAWLEHNPGQPVEVRFDAPSAEELKQMDDLLAAKGGKVEGLPIAPITPSFTEERCRSREEKIVNGLRAGFNQVATGDILALSGAKRLLGKESAFTRPTLAIHYVVKPSQDFYFDDAKTRAFVGITVDFSLALSVPEAGAPMNMAFSVEPPEHFTVRDDVRRPAGSKAQVKDSSVYDVMATEAFARLNDRLSATFFKTAMK